MKDLWLTYDIAEGFPSVITILENCDVDEDKDGNIIIRGGTEVSVTADELNKIIQILKNEVEKGLEDYE
jgi:hypothetical protein